MEKPIEVIEFREQSFNYQLDCLKVEITLVNSAIDRMESITQTVKNFALVSWAAGITIFFSQDELRKFVVFTAILPIVFWLIDAWWVHLHRGARLRLYKIRDFINSENLVESFKQQNLVGFTVLDVLGEQYKGTKEYEATTGFKRVFLYKEMISIYGGLIVFSLVIGVLALITF